MNMEEMKLPEGENRACVITAPKFTAKPLEIIAACLSYVLAYIWIEFAFGCNLFEKIAFPLGFLVCVEIANWGKKRKWEDYIWLACFLMLWAGSVFHRHNAFEDEFLPLFIFHGEAIWYALSRSEALFEGKTGRLLPADALFGAVVYPFKHYFLRIRTIWYGLSKIGKEKKDWEKLLWVLAAVAFGGVLFVGAVNMLSLADDEFGNIVESVTQWFSFDVDELTVYRIFFSKPCGAYLFGVMCGMAREKRDEIDRKRSALDGFLARLGKVPAAAWLSITLAFCAVYAFFFALQSKYLFGAFTRTLPEGFIVSEYARQGFFELCKVMAINFTLLWLVLRTSAGNARKNLSLRIASILLIAESMVFAIIAASKLWLYIDCFGFTPLRLQSAWLVSVLFAGCIAAFVSVIADKRTTRWWAIYSAVSLCALTLI